MTAPILDQDEQTAAENAVDTRAVAPAGNYLCRITEVSKWTTGKSLVWKYRVGEGDWTGKEFWEFTGLEEAGIWKTKERYASLNFPLSAEEAEMVDTIVRVTVEVGFNQRNGKETNPVTDVVRVMADLPAEAPSTAKIDADIDDAFGPAPDADDDGEPLPF